MRLREFIVEARKNPELNPKINVWHIMEKRLANTVDYIDNHTPNLFANFLGVDKIGVNPGGNYKTTPIGIYGYPVNYILETVDPSKTMADLPYAGNEKYINVFSIDYTKIFNILNCSELISDEMIERIIKIYAQEAKVPYDDAKNIIISSIPKRIIGQVGLYNFIKKLCSEVFTRQVWNRKMASRLTTLLKKLGFDGVYDGGYGYIHRNEPTQIVVFNPQAIKNNQRLYNKAYQNKKEYGQYQHKQVIAFRKLLDSDDYQGIINFLDSVNYDAKFVKMINSHKLRMIVINHEPRSIYKLKNPTYDEQLFAIGLLPDEFIRTEGLSLPDKDLLHIAIERFPIEDIVIKRVDRKFLTYSDKVALIKKKPELFFKLHPVDKQLGELAISLGTDPKTTRLRVLLKGSEDELQRLIDRRKSELHLHEDKLQKFREEFSIKSKELAKKRKTLSSLNSSEKSLINQSINSLENELKDIERHIMFYTKSVSYSRNILKQLIYDQRYLLGWD